MLIARLYPPQGHQANNTKKRPMRLVTSWVLIEDFDIDPVIPAPSSNTKMEKTGLIVLILEITTIV